MVPSNIHIRVHVCMYTFLCLCMCVCLNICVSKSLCSPSQYISSVTGISLSLFTHTHTHTHYSSLSAIPTDCFLNCWCSSPPHKTSLCCTQYMTTVMTGLVVGCHGTHIALGSWISSWIIFYITRSRHSTQLQCFHKFFFIITL